MFSGLFNSVFGFLLLMGVLVTIHEFGHFYAAKKLGFKVLTFSIGFGKKVWGRVGKDGVEYRIGLIPLGGYVGLLDERVHDIQPSEKDQTFNAKPVWKRAVVIAAGPGVNLLFAIVLLFGLYLYGMPAIKAKIDTPPANSVMAIAGFERGDEVVAIEGRSIRTAEEMLMGFVEHLNDGEATVEVLRNGRLETLEIQMDEPLRLNANEYIDQLLGATLYMPLIPPVIGIVVDSSASSNAGILVNDEIIKMDETSIHSWQDLLLKMQELDQQDINEHLLNLTIMRHKQIIEVPVQLTRDGNGRFMLGIGVSNIDPEIMAEFESLQVLQKHSIIDSFKYAIKDTYYNSLLIFKFIGRMITGEIHPNVMAGPVSIADVAGKKLDSGWIHFIQLMALFSVNLGILNLLPIPVLDGGRLVGLGIEAVAGRNRIPARLSMMVMQLGALFLFLFMALIIFYDITKWF
ncbi:RIP metalloprotease RseP [Ignatzschineria sp. LJL83]